MFLHYIKSGLKWKLFLSEKKEIKIKLEVTSGFVFLKRASNQATGKNNIIIFMYAPDVLRKIKEL